LPAQAKRRFLKLNVGEVSLVDSPANEVEFLVTKNLEENVMGEQQANAAERVEVEQAAGGESDVQAVLKHVSAIVENIASVAKAEGGQASAPAIAAATGGETATETESEEDVEKSSFTAMMKTAGVTLSKEQMDKLKAAGFDPSQSFPTAKKPMAKTSKAAEPATEAEAVAETVLTIEGLSSLITKAKKFTPGRIEKLKGAVEALKGLLEEIDSVPQGTNPGVSPSGSQSFGSSGVKGLAEGSNVDTSKAKDPTMADVLKAVNGLVEVVKGLGSEVESIKKARPASESLEAKGGTETNTKKSGNIWSGLL